jgi:type I restriction system adenine methylase HsdM
MSEYNLKSIKAEFKSKGIFYTTKDLATTLKSFIDIDVTEVYDPTCGDGSLLSVFENDIPKFGQEINESQLKAAKIRLKNFEGYCGDTLKRPFFQDKKFNCIIANPPFSIAWNPPVLNGIFTDERFSNVPALPPKSKADFAFILHILHYLDQNGIAVVLNFPGVLYRGKSEGLIRKWIVEQNYIEKVIRIPGKKFVDTTIETCVIVFKKNKSNTDIQFIDLEIEDSYIANIDEVRKNDYQLSVNSFVVQKKEEKKYDPVQLQFNARKQMLARLKADIEIDKIVCSLEGYDFLSYLDEIGILISDYRKSFE